MLLAILAITQIILLPHAIIFMGAAGWFASQSAICRTALEEHSDDPTALSLVVSIVTRSDKLCPWFVTYFEWLQAQFKRRQRIMLD